MTQLKVPSWVSADDELARVTCLDRESAKSDLFQEARQHVEPFYDNGSIEEACRAIEEIIAQDPRAMRDGRGKANNEAFEFTFLSIENSSCGRLPPPCLIYNSNPKLGLLAFL
eukprot:CAMPEP_0202508528 /NCGR_PEP_ID=MMETSP1361-20130828/52300_1 /ASSEMBLY_ACC=CAM_ASM_000849 /TAXON_ID=210615 /ORGANISM="Staurosira complex sp., Strain CCMP2646" /LENGTH=112 /DNA_ID=CAMNT_0049142707 /DNA_START=148 /DNA_END=486 /DNA_ORIENTATION=-